ncbi:MAG: hypothetical protein ACRY3E_04735 [Candidatus Lariskella arthropodorum]
MRNILLIILSVMLFFMQQGYADDGSKRQVFELLLQMDAQSQQAIKQIQVSSIKNGNLESKGQYRYLLWNNNQEDSLYQVKLTLQDDSQFVFYLNPFFDDYRNDYPNGTSYNYDYSWMLGIWNSAKQSINQSNGSYKFKSYSGRYYINNSLLKHIALNIYEQVEPITHGNWKDNESFMPSYSLYPFNACYKGIFGNISDETMECMVNQNDQNKYQMYFVTINIDNLFMGNAKEYLLGFAHHNAMITWQQKTEENYTADGASSKKIYFQASYNQQPFCKVYMSDDLSSITSVEQTQYAPISCSYQSDYYEPKFIFACTGSSGIGLANNNQSACGWLSHDNIQSQAFNSNINDL